MTYKIRPDGLQRVLVINCGTFREEYVGASQCRFRALRLWVTEFEKNNPRFLFQHKYFTTRGLFGPKTKNQKVLILGDWPKHNKFFTKNLSNLFNISEARVFHLGFKPIRPAPFRIEQFLKVEPGFVFHYLQQAQRPGFDDKLAFSAVNYRDSRVAAAESVEAILCALALDCIPVFKETLDPYFGYSSEGDVNRISESSNLFHAVSRVATYYQGNEPSWRGQLEAQRACLTLRPGVYHENLVNSQVFSFLASRWSRPI